MKENIPLEQMIPRGPYCYMAVEIANEKDYSQGFHILSCPFWELKKSQPEQENGYCKLLDVGDWEEDVGFGMLWDGIKECGVNLDEKEENI